MSNDEFVFVPSIVNIEGKMEGLGIYSEEALAFEKLKKKIGDNWSSGYKEAQLVMWTLDSDETKAVPLKHMYANVCPICDERTFWTDVVEMNALCYLPACQAWIESSDIETDKIDCGWPPIGYTAQVDNLEEALTSLRIYGAKIRASTIEDSDIFTHRTLLEEYERSLDEDTT
ncbi:MAG TPA: hypothetical protein QF644_04070 [Candidatus Poseidoniaceae archaeon]|nr:hypothetical protein [Candidatus Poseidoniaceae archaeon]